MHRFKSSYVIAWSNQQWKSFTKNRFLATEYPVLVLGPCCTRPPTYPRHNHHHEADSLLLRVFPGTGTDWIVWIIHLRVFHPAFCSIKKKGPFYVTKSSLGFGCFHKQRIRRYSSYFDDNDRGRPRSDCRSGRLDYPGGAFIIGGRFRMFDCRFVPMISFLSLTIHESTTYSRANATSIIVTCSALLYSGIFEQTWRRYVIGIRRTFFRAG